MKKSSCSFLTLVIRAFWRSDNMCLFFKYFAWMLGLFIYLLLAVCCCGGSSLVLASGGYSLVLVHGLLIVAASLVAEHGI